MFESERAGTNQILSRFSAGDLHALRPHFERVDLPLRTPLEVRGKRADRIYFIESGFASVVGSADDRVGIEVGLIGREGMTGLSVVLATNERVATDTYMQNAGSALCMRAVHLKAAIQSSPNLHAVMLRYAYAFLNQTTRTAVANARGRIEQRLARWLLMAADRVNGELKLTQEFLSIMLGVHRPSVTAALKQLENAGMISQRRGGITIVDRKALIALTRGIYMPGDSG
jgi:CRP-like cAMP-binding protein